MTDLKVGFVGIGTMGRPMAGHVAAAGYTLTVYDINADAAREFAREAGAAVADGLAGMGADADVVITMLPKGSDVTGAVLGAGGLAEGLRRGSVVIDMSSSEPGGTVALAAELAARGIDLIDAPVSGGRAKAVDGTLTLIVGGKDAAFARCEALLKTMGSQIFRTGAAGSGHAAKALNNLLNALGQLASAETLMIGRRFGLDPEILIDVINASSGMTHATQHKMRQFVLSRSYASGFAMDLMLKDMDIALGMARETATDVPLSSLGRRLWGEARDSEGAGQDQMALTRWVERKAGTDLAPGD